MEHKACIVYLLLLISWPERAEQSRELPQNFLMKYLAQPDVFVSDVLAETESKKTQDEPEVSRTIFPHVAGHMAQDLESWIPTDPPSYPEPHSNHPSHPHTKRKADLFFRKDAKKFWDLFMLKTKSRSEEIVLPIKTNEMYQDVCSTLPFSQSIVHKNCEKVVLQNNLCFGKCSSFHIPGLEDRLYTFCSHCLPTKFFMKRLEMNCTQTAPVIKVVTIVEECKCEVQKAKAPEIGFLHLDQYAYVYEHS